jgi:hypothetical protein
MRRSSRGAAPGGESRIRAPEYLGYEPTDGQLKAKSEFWAKFRDDPAMDPKHLGPMAIAELIDAPSLTTWWKEPGFRTWFLDGEEWRGDIEFATALWAKEAAARMMRADAMSDKDFVAYGKLLAEVSGRMPRGGAGAGAGKPPKQLTEAEAMAQFVAAAKLMGFTPPAHLEAPKPKDEDTPV